MQSLREEEERLAEEEKDDVVLTYDRPEAANKVILRKGPSGTWEICHPPQDPPNTKPASNISNPVTSADQHCNHLKTEEPKQPAKFKYHTRHKRNNNLESKLAKQEVVSCDSPALDGVCKVALDITAQQANTLDEQKQLNHQYHTPNT